METAGYILAIFFWVLCAMAIVTLMIYVYIQLQYYRWDKMDKEQDNLVKKLSEHISEVVDEKINPGGGI